MNRRSFLIGLAAGLAPAVIRTPGLLLPVRALVLSDGVQLMSISHPVSDYLTDESAWAMGLNEASLETIVYEWVEVPGKFGLRLREVYTPS